MAEPVTPMAKAPDGVARSGQANAQTAIAITSQKPSRNSQVGCSALWTAIIAMKNGFCAWTRRGRLVEIEHRDHQDRRRPRNVHMKVARCCR